MKRIESRFGLRELIIGFELILFSIIWILSPFWINKGIHFYKMSYIISVVGMLFLIILMFNFTDISIGFSESGKR